MGAKEWIALAGLMLSLMGAAFIANDRFVTVVQASDWREQDQIDTERARLETELRLAKHELKHATDEDEIDYLKGRILILEERLLDLEDDR